MDLPNRSGQAGSLNGQEQVEQVEQLEQVEVNRLSGKRERVIEAAAKLFFHNGISSTSMEQIAQSVPVSKMTIYNYFQSKERLLELVMDRYAEQAIQELQDITDKAEDPLEAMRQLVLRKERVDFSEAFVKELIEGYPQVSAKLMRIQRDTVQPVLERLILRAQQEGRVRKELSPHIVLLMIQAIKEFFSRADVWKEVDDMHLLSEQVMGILYNGILSEGYQAKDGGS
jgi:AcrR family transcriptional regulator